MKRSEKKEFVQKLKDEIDTSSSVIVAHYSGLTVEDSDQLRSEMRSNGAKFKVTKNRLTKLALEQTQFKDITHSQFAGQKLICHYNQVKQEDLLEYIDNYHRITHIVIKYKSKKYAVPIRPESMVEDPDKIYEHCK